ncbi:hypothetical protein AVEN_74067-1 [Araneus ventricosus]|uniref:Uncharacterized protein n=1 Tax=Araneus ventricosus TaxID=182803 RepID=A0A4Y2MBI5_ARAVE|nr:hypothetical protein AVEN_74067-1 [Araneus ventricosus]
MGWWKTTFDDISGRHELSYEIKMNEIGRVVEAGGLDEEFFMGRNLSTIRQPQPLDRFRSFLFHMKAYDVLICRHGSPAPPPFWNGIEKTYKECMVDKCFFDFVPKWGGGKTTFYDISGRHKLSYEKKLSKSVGWLRLSDSMKNFLWGKTFGQFASHNHPTDFENFYFI